MFPIIRVTVGQSRSVSAYAKPFLLRLRLTGGHRI